MSDIKKAIVSNDYDKPPAKTGFERTGVVHASQLGNLDGIKALAEQAKATPRIDFIWPSILVPGEFKHDPDAVEAEGILEFKPPPAWQGRAAEYEAQKDRRAAAKLFDQEYPGELFDPWKDDKP